MNTSKIKKKFKEVPQGYGPIPFWFWNGDMDLDEVGWQVDEMHKKGISGFIMHGRHGLSVPYLSDDWFEVVNLCVEKARKYGMKAWIYDERNWPSGTAGGKVTAHKKYRQRFMMMVHKEVTGPRKVIINVPDTKDDVQVIKALRAKKRNGKVDLASVQDTTSSTKGLRLTAKVPKGKHIVAVFVSREGRMLTFDDHYLDLMNPEAVEYFLKVTHEEYARRFKKYFGKAIAGVFTDEPFFFSMSHGNVEGVTYPCGPCTRDHFKRLAEKGLQGKKANQALMASFFDCGPKTAMLRYEYWKALTYLYADAFYKKFGDWCQKHKMSFTGHVCEGPFPGQIQLVGDIFPHLRHMQVPGMDYLGAADDCENKNFSTKFSPDKMLGRVTPHKFISSIAHHQRRERVLSETLGCAGWGLTPGQQKWMVDFLYTQGVNLFVPHAFFYTAKGKTRRDAPPSMFYHATYWEFYKVIADYVSRLGWLLTRGKHVAQVALLYPIASAWAEYISIAPVNKFSKYSGSPSLTDRGNFVDAGLHRTVLNLLRTQHDFDYFDDVDFARARVKDGKLVLEEESYTVLVIPPCHYITRTTFSKIQSFIRAGGKVVSIGMLPEAFVEDVEDKTPGKFFGNLFGIDVARNNISAITKNKQTYKLKRNKSAVFVEENSGKVNWKRLDDAVDQAINSLDQPHLTIHASRDRGQIYYMQRRIEETDVYFFSNHTRDAQQVEIVLPGEKGYEVWNPETGGDYPVQDICQEKGKTLISLSFQPYGSCVIASAPKTRYTKEVIPRRKVIELPQKWDFSIEGDNVYMPVRYRFSHSKIKNENIWYLFQADFNLKGKPRRLAVLLDNEDEKRIGNYAHCRYSIIINGHEIFDWKYNRTIDHRMREYDISPYVKNGKNTVEICYKHCSWMTDALIPDMWIIGSFKARGRNLEAFTSGKIQSKKSWTTQGFKNYSGTGVYETEFTLSKTIKGKRLFLKIGRFKDTVQVFVNGKECGVRLWSPYLIEITKAASSGRNHIRLRVQNTLSNTFQERPLPSGLIGKVTIIEA